MFDIYYLIDKGSILYVYMMLNMLIEIVLLRLYFVYERHRHHVYSGIFVYCI